MYALGQEEKSTTDNIVNTVGWRRIYYLLDSICTCRYYNIFYSYILYLC